MKKILTEKQAVELKHYQDTLKWTNVMVMQEYRREKYEAWLKMDTAKKANAEAYRKLIAPILSEEVSS